MAEEIKKVISIDTTKGSKSIKQLREEVAGLTAELEDLEIGSSDYSKKLEDLVDVQNKLTVATESMQGKTVNAVKAFDSINQVAGGLAGGVSAVSAAFTLFGKDTENLEKTMVKLQAAIAIVQGIGGLKGLGEGVLNGVKAFKALAVSMGTATTATGGLSIAMGVLRTAIISTGIGALVVALGMLVDWAIKAASSTNDLKDSLADLNDATDAWGTKYAYANTQIAALDRKRERELAEGKKNEIQIWKDYADAIGQINAELWVDFGEVQKQYNEGFIQLLQGNKKFRKEFKASNVDNWEDFASAVQWGLKTSSNYVDEFNSKLSDEEKAQYEELKSTYETYLEKRNESTQKSAELYEKVKLMEIAADRKAREEAIADENAAKDRLKQEKKELLKIIEDFSEENKKILLDEASREQYELNVKYQNQINALKRAKELEIITIEDYNKKLKQVNDAYNKEYIDNQNAAYKESLEERLAYLQQMQDRESQLFANKEASLSAGMSGNYTTSVYDLGLFSKGGAQYQSTKDVNKQYEDTLAYNEQLYNLTRDRILRENELMSQQQIILKEQYDNKLITEQEYADQSQAIKLQQEANDIALSQAQSQREEADLQAFIERQNKKQQAIQATMSVASSLSGALANVFKQEASDDSKSQKQREKSFKVYKALATTQAIIDTISSAQGAYKAMVGIPFVGPILAPIAAAAAVVAGIANVKAIQNEQLPSSGSSTSDAGTNAPSALNTAPVEYTRNLLGDKETDQLNNPIKCYVVESDITNAQTKVAVTESNASF